MRFILSALAIWPGVLDLRVVDLLLRLVLDFLVLAAFLAPSDLDRLLLDLEAVEAALLRRLARDFLVLAAFLAPSDRDFDLRDFLVPGILVSIY